MDQRAELATFLRSRRERLQPSEVALVGPGHGQARRRTSGLRREEVAVLAGLSVTHYTRIEQGRGARPSAQVLDALARALRLSEDERAYLFQVGRHAPARSVARRPGGPGVPRSVLRLLELLGAAPALVLDVRMDVLAWNPMAALLLVDFAELLPAQRNMVRLTFLHPQMRSRFTDFDAVARESVSALRAALPALDGDERLALLIGELTLASEDFRRHWNRRDVKQKSRGRKTFHHPVAGHLDLDYEAMRLHGDLLLVVYTAPAGSPTDTALHQLGTQERLADETDPDAESNLTVRGGSQTGGSTGREAPPSGSSVS